MKWILALRGCNFSSSAFNMNMFKVISVLGRGFYGKVMLCQQISTGDVYAIKTIHKKRLIMSNKVCTVISERNILSKITHPFIVNMKFAFQTESKFYLGLEFVSGGELFNHMQKVGLLSLEEAKLYCAEVALALDHLHSHGIIYRDLKPENILLDSTGHIKITDFGLSKDLSQDTTTDTFCGTNEYLAPEIIRREDYSFEVDWWALGILTYEMLFGRTPYASNNKARQYDGILNKLPDLTHCPDEATKQFISSLLEKDPHKRPKFEQIKKMAFFDGLDFDDVLAKKVKPKYVPVVTSDTSAANFDSEFTQETPVDSYAQMMSSGDKLVGFSYNASSLGSQPCESSSNMTATLLAVDSDREEVFFSDGPQTLSPPEKNCIE